jgi:hypothetical protein
VLSDANGFGFDNGAQQWNFPLLVAVNADAQVDLVGTGIGVECFVEAQDGSRGAISTAENRLIFAAALNGEWRDVSRSSRMH